MDVLDALKDYTPNFLPPNEAQAGTSLSFLDGVTNLIHRLPNWDSYQYNRHKAEAYEEIAKAWALVIREAAKKGGGIQLQFGGWDQKLAKHNEMSGGKMEEAMNELHTSLGWMGNNGAAETSGPGGANDPGSIRQQLLNGTYGLSQPVRVGPW
jgi:protein Cut8